MRLIDANGLMDRLRGNVLIDVTPELEDTILHQPIAFDKEKVIQKLKNLRTQYYITIANTGDEKLDCAYENVGNALDTAIEIIEKGGIE